MRRVAGTIAVVVALCAQAAPAGAVVGGTPVPDGQLRYVANISIGGSFGCTGTLIAPDWVMTAGHCGSLTGSLTGGIVPTPIGLPAGAYDVKLGSVHADGTGAEDHAVTQVVVDSDYMVTNGTGNDVTLLALDHASSIAPVHIAALGERHIWDPGTKATIVNAMAANANQPKKLTRVAPNGFAAARSSITEPSANRCKHTVAGRPVGRTRREASAGQFVERQGRVHPT
jgi:secreted trypsin-like serine protease